MDQVGGTGEGGMGDMGSTGRVGGGRTHSSGTNRDVGGAAFVGGMGGMGRSEEHMALAAWARTGWAWAHHPWAVKG